MLNRCGLTYLTTAISLLIDGFAFGMVLFLIASGLTVTLGIMRILNIAHCGFAMIGGYFALAMVQYFNVGLFTALPFAVAATVLVGVLLERTVFRWVYETAGLSQVLMTVGLTFLMIASVNFFFSSLVYTLPTPQFLAGTWRFGDVSISVYRMFLCVVSMSLAGTIWFILDCTDFGARLRAAVDNPRMARCVGIDVRRIFAITFAGGCALAAVAGVLGTQMLPLQPSYPITYLSMVLIAVAVGGFGSLKGSLIAAIAYGVIDTYCRYLFPAAGAFGIYVILVLFLLVRPHGLYGRA